MEVSVAERAGLGRFVQRNPATARTGYAMWPEMSGSGWLICTARTTTSYRFPKTRWGRPPGHPGSPEAGHGTSSPRTFARRFVEVPPPSSSTQASAFAVRLLPTSLLCNPGSLLLSSGYRFFFVLVFLGQIYCMARFPRTIGEPLISLSVSEVVPSSDWRCWWRQRVILSMPETMIPTRRVAVGTRVAVSEGRRR